MAIYDKTHLEFNEQLDLLMDRGLKVNDKQKAIERLKNINYYKIKEFSRPYLKTEIINGKEIPKYDNISFEQIIVRFYQDKNLRMAFLHIIEKIELSFKTKFAYILGKKHGPFGYLKFNNWCNKEIYCKFYLSEKEDAFNSRLYQKIKNSDNFIISEYKLKYDSIQIPIWLAVEILTFGEILFLFDLMSTKNKTAIANEYNCTHEELASWLKNLKLLRNMCAHNSNVIDVQFKTLPPIRSEWSSILHFKDPTAPTNKIARSIVIMKYLIEYINPDYGFGDVFKYLNKLIRNSSNAANDIGFCNPKALSFLIKNNQVSSLSQKIKGRV
ncbi:Abi family protein [Cetobacterium sp.]|uniref:Abi family protein n=1 Tax=Cetobacterium sp. TaxID=2071632 RepID=UPI003EE4F4C8